MSRRPILVAAAILLFAAGFAAGRLTLAPTPPASATVAPAEKPPATRSPGRTPRVEAVPGDELATAKAEAAAWKALYDGLALEVYGEPVPFPADTPEVYTEEGVRAALDEVLRECEVPGELIGVDCAEYPCMVRFRSVDPISGESTFRSITRCPAWIERYGDNGASVSQGAADCGDGRKEPFLLLSPGWPESRERLDAEGNLSKRNKARWEETVAQWACAPPPPR